MRRSLSNDFKTDGVTVVRNVLTSSEIGAYKKYLAKISGISEADYHHRWSLADGLTQYEEFWPLIFQKRLVEVVGEVIGPAARFVQCTDLHVHRASLSWHRDSAQRKFGIGPDWSDGYKVVRVAFYLHPHSFGIIPASYVQEYQLSRFQIRLWQVLTRLNSDPIPQFGIRTKKGIAPTRPIWITTRPGDCIIFDARLLHAAPPVTSPKHAMFSCYGDDNSHSRTHQHYYMHERRELNYQPMSPVLIGQLKSADLYLADKEDSAGATRI